MSHQIIAANHDFPKAYFTVYTSIWILMKSSLISTFLFFYVTRKKQNKQI